MRRLLAIVCVLASPAVARPAMAQEQEQEEEQEQEAQEPQEDPNIVLSYDGWFLRIDAGVAYTRTITTFHPIGDDSEETTLESDGFGPTIDLAVAARLGRDVTLGGLGQLVHSPATLRDGDWDARSQGLYYAAAFVDHRLPWSIVHIGGGAGGGYLYASGPDDDSIGGVAPVGTLWLGLDFSVKSRVALGLVADVVGAAMEDTENVDGVRNDFDTFLLVIGLSFTLRISEPSWPDSFPTLARRSTP